MPRAGNGQRGSGMDSEVAAPPHRLAMEAALRRAAAGDGWLQLADFPVDYRGPTDRPMQLFAGRDRPVLASLKDAAARLPDRVAYADAARDLSFAGLVEAVARLAREIRAAGGDGPVGLLLPPDAGAPVALLACLAAGRPALLLEAGGAPPRNAAIL